MVIYTLSSTDPEHYNRVQAKLPIEYTAKYVNITVTSLTSNCNIEVMNERDYIQFIIDNEPIKIFMKPYSKLTTASLPYVLQDIFTEANINIIASISDLDTLILTSDKQFSITDMSYNMKLITGFYSLKTTDYPIVSQPHTEEYIIEPVIKPATAFTAQDLNIKHRDTKPVEYTVTPPDAYGYNIQLSTEDTEHIKIENNLIYAVQPTTEPVTVKVELRNPGTLITSAPDFSTTITVKVVEGIKTEITDVKLPEKIILYNGEDITVYPKVVPVNADYYISEWSSDRPEVASVVQGFITTNQVGTCIITYTINNNLEEQTQTITKEIFIEVKSPIATKTVYKINAPAVGYMLSTPILYLLTSIGAPVFFNEIDNHNKMQSATVAMVLNNSYSSSFPIVAQQAEIITRAPLNYTSNVYFWLVDANMQEVKLLNPLYITIRVDPEYEQTYAQLTSYDMGQQPTTTT